MKRIRVEFAREHVELQAEESCWIPVRRGAASKPLSDVANAVRHGLEAPLEFPPLRRAITPDDHLAVVLDEGLNQPADLLGPVLEHLLEAGVELERITVVCATRSSPESEPDWKAALPEKLRRVPVEVHQPAERNKLSYLTSTKAGRRIYLNRTLVDADQLVVLGRLGFDPVLGYRGGMGDIFPALSDEATRAEFGQKFSAASPGQRTWPAEQEAEEVGWLLGMPFFVQVVEGPGESVLHVVAGKHDATAKAGRALLEQRWRVRVPRTAELVIATLPAKSTFADVTRAFSCAARVTRPGGRIAVLSRTSGPLSRSLELARKADSPADALAQARLQKLDDSASVWELATAAMHARLYLLSALPAETVEESFTTPLDHAGQLQQLVSQSESIIVLPDGHRTLAEVESS